jgi:hypothetical protein
MNHRSPIRRNTQISLKPAHRSEGSVFSMATPDSAPESMAERKRPFVEDFNMEHSCSNVTVALRAYSAASDAGEQGRSRNPAALSMNTPSCIYLG